jgi:hypothetical protein
LRVVGKEWHPLHGNRLRKEVYREDDLGERGGATAEIQRVLRIDGRGGLVEFGRKLRGC